MKGKFQIVNARAIAAFMWACALELMQNLDTHPGWPGWKKVGGSVLLVFAFYAGAIFWQGAEEASGERLD